MVNSGTVLHIGEHYIFMANVCEIFETATGELRITSTNGALITIPKKDAPRLLAWLNERSVYI